MDTLSVVAVSAHVFFGIISIICYFGVWSTLVGLKPVSSRLKTWSLLGMVTLLFSLLSIGSYYVTYYSYIVKPIIGNSKTPWAHYIFMETKEHVFFFLLFLSIAISSAAFFLKDELHTNPKLRRALANLAGLFVAVGIFITLAGIYTSGSVR